jgi:hypothetical protein
MWAMPRSEARAHPLQVRLTRAVRRVRAFRYYPYCRSFDISRLIESGFLVRNKNKD